NNNDQPHTLAQGGHALIHCPPPSVAPLRSHRRVAPAITMPRLSDHDGVDGLITMRGMRTGSRWVHLRTCQTCGGTRCCDSSPQRHASEHAGRTGHPVVASAEPGERWLYCYPDDAFTEY